MAAGGAAANREQSRQSQNRNQADINANMYALVPKHEGEDLLAKTFQSFKLQKEGGMSQNEADEF